MGKQHMRSARTHAGETATWRSVTAAAILILALPATARSQAAGNGERRVEVSLSGGGLSGGPNGPLDSAMRNAGLDDPSPGIWGPAVAHPFSRPGGGASFDASVRLRGPWFVGVTYSRTSTGSS